ncbi:MAG: hypothetical protein ACRC2T_19790 [Thermoguttaceae bacterium]
MQKISFESIKKTPFWAYFFRHRYFFWKLKLIQKKRNPWDCFLKWQEKKVNWDHLKTVSEIIARTAGWPNMLFIPDDDIAALTTDFDGSFIDIHIWQELETQLFKKQMEYTGQMQHGSYFDFLERVIAQAVPVR